MAEIISQLTMNHLPFKAEAVSRWDENSDLQKFLVALYDQPCVMTGPDGVEHHSNYSDYGSYLFDGGIEKMNALANELSESSEDVHHQNPDKIHKKKHEFLKDDHFGLAAKSIVAWEAIDSAMLAKIQTEIWLQTLHSKPDICTICHAENNFESKQIDSVGNEPLFELICKKCGHKWHSTRRPK